MFPGRNPPSFIVLAQRILSISANSASCERLFSIFGATLTKLRNRLGVETLQSLGELKMHIRDEYTKRSQEVKKRLKQRFTPGAVVRLEAAGPSTIPDHTEDLGSGFEPTESQEFRDLIESGLRLAEEDHSEEYTTVSPSLPVEIDTLFDFTRHHWVDMYASSSRHAFDDELELYEMLDLDADGEESVDLNIDESTAEALTM
jgi:hAT family C-terminal dimerisation region